MIRWAVWGTGMLLLFGPLALAAPSIGRSCVLVLGLVCMVAAPRVPTGWMR